MLKCFSHFFACLLLVLLPLQGIAVANMSVCNSMLQAQNLKKTFVQHNVEQHAMPCHMLMGGMSNVKHNSYKHDSACKTTCATLCAGLNVITEMPSDIKPASFMLSTFLISKPNQVYTSITQPNLQRPPILLS